jgi:fibronectin type 3 domain-containing protein
MRQTILFLFAISIFVAPAGRMLASQSVLLTWDPSPTAGVTGYTVFYGVTRGNLNHQVSVGPFTSATISGLADGQTYYFEVTASVATGQQSPPSNVANYSTPGSPAPTSGLVPPANAWMQYDANSQQWTLAWNASSSANVRSYRVYWRSSMGAQIFIVYSGIFTQLVVSQPGYYEVTAVDASGAESVPTANIPLGSSQRPSAPASAWIQNSMLQWSASPSPGITNYHVYYRATANAPVYIAYAGNAMQLAVTQHGYYDVTAIDAFGAESLPTASVASGSNQRPLPPASAWIRNSVLGWTASPSANITSYHVYWRAALNAPNYIVYAGSAVQFAVSKAGYYEVTATDGSGAESLPTADVVFGSSQRPSPPGNARVSYSTRLQQWVLTWSASTSAGAGSYHVYYRPTPTAGTYIVYAGNTPQFALNKNGYYEVTTLDAYGNESAPTANIPFLNSHSHGPALTGASTVTAKSAAVTAAVSATTAPAGTTASSSLKTAALVSASKVSSAVANNANANMVAAAATPPDLQLKIDTSALRTSGALITLSGSSSAAGRIQYSTDLVNWMTWTNFSGNPSGTSFRDANAARSPQRFYRAVVP